jgi:hypothetical protein
MKTYRGIGASIVNFGPRFKWMISSSIVNFGPRFKWMISSPIVNFGPRFKWMISSYIVNFGPRFKWMIISSIINSGPRFKCMISFMLRSLYPCERRSTELRSEYETRAFDKRTSIIEFQFRMKGRTKKYRTWKIRGGLSSGAGMLLSVWSTEEKWGAFIDFWNCPFRNICTVW